MCGVVHFFLLSLFSHTSVRTPSVATPTILTVVKGSVLSSAISILSKHEKFIVHVIRTYYDVIVLDV